jgi:hypothetical protein
MNKHYGGYLCKCGCRGGATPPRAEKASIGWISDEADRRLKIFPQLVEALKRISRNVCTDCDNYEGEESCQDIAEEALRQAKGDGNE